MRSIELYNHNKLAYEKAEKMLLEEGKAAIVHPTGTGKSFIAFTFVLTHPDKKFIWLSPSEYIYELQCKNLWEKQHIKFTNIDFYTYAWLMRNNEIIEELQADYIILDEFHRAGAHEWEKSVRKLIQTHPQAKLLGLSATKVRYLDNRRDMTEELFDGYIASEMTICEAMAQGILPTPKYVIASYSYELKLKEYESRAKTLANKKQKAKVEKLIEKLRRKLQDADGMDIIFKKHLPKEDAKLIIFCCNSEHMMEIMAQIPVWFGKIDVRPHVYLVSTYNPESEEDFKSFVMDDSDHLKLLFCIDMLNEGIHIDDVDAVVLCRPTRSPIVYKQQIGRAIAVGAAQKPVVYDMVNNFDSLWQINTIKQEFNAIIHAQQGDKEDDEDNLSESFEIIDELRDCRELLEEIQKNLDATWDMYYHDLIRFTEENGNCIVPKRYRTEDGLRLGIWLLRQKELYREGKLQDEKITALDKLGVVWDYWREANFKHNLDLLIKYKEEKGNFFMTTNYKTPDGVALATWCTSLRGLRKRGKLSDERIRILEEIGFPWNIDDAEWEEGYKHANEYYEKHGNLNMPKDYVTEDGYNLGPWLTTQRGVRNGRKHGNLTEKKIKRLDELHMDWSDRSRDDFEKNLDAFKKYAESGGNSIIPFRYVTEEGIELGKWNSRIRNLYFNGKLQKQKEKRLKEAGYVFHRFSYTWHANYQKARRYFEKHGDLLVTCAYSKKYGSGLQQWVNIQRKEYRKANHGNLDEEQVKLLEEMYIDEGSCTEIHFNNGLKDLRDYILKYGSPLVPNDYVTDEGFHLGKWISRQKNNYWNNKLPDEKLHILNEFGMVWESTETVRAKEYWDIMYKEAEKYAKENGSIKNIKYNHVTEDGKKLGSWIAQQRRIRRGTIKHSIKMTKERMEMLDKIGMKWE